VIIGPIFFRELVTAPRRPQHFINRTAYVTALVILMATAWLLMTGTQKITSVGDMARFGSALFQLLAPLQLALLSFLGALTAASNVAQEKDKKTIVLLLMTRLNNSELVLGKLMASLLEVFTMLAAALPVFVMITLFGGVSLEQVARAYAVTIVTILAAGSLGNMLALWREKTFQTLAMTALGIVLWVGACEAVLVLAPQQQLGGTPLSTWMTGLSPFRAILAATQPGIGTTSYGLLGDGLPLFYGVGLAVAAILCGIAMLRVRIWNPSRDARAQQPETSEQASIWGHEHDLAGSDPLEIARRREVAETAREGHVDARVRTASQASRQVWDNPILWREMCTWAYGKKVLIIRLAYLLFTILAGAGLYFVISGEPVQSHGGTTVIPEAARPLAPFFVVSLVIVNALAVTSITNERDGGALDLLLVTDLSPPEFLLGKIGGVAYVTKEMIAAPLLLCIALFYFQRLTLEELAYCVVGLLIMNLFVIMLGVHCGMIYANSRTAIGVSLGTVFFLFLGVVTLLVLMVSFSGSFHNQLVPFLAFNVGGGVGLFVALGARNPSAAIGLASFSLPFATFFAVTSFLLPDQQLNCFLVTSGAYGLTIAALAVPALSEFDFAMGRNKGGGE
jgi:ABC-type transport system involved in multi-copper enzyme maturation permease subunit